MHIIVNTQNGEVLKDWNTGGHAEFFHYDEAKRVCDTLNRYTPNHYAVSPA